MSNVIPYSSDNQRMAEDIAGVFFHEQRIDDALSDGWALQGDSQPSSGSHPLSRSGWNMHIRGSIEKRRTWRGLELRRPSTSNITTLCTASEYRPGEPN